jgi:hypothetical protein
VLLELLTQAAAVVVAGPYKIIAQPLLVDQAVLEL